MVPASLESSKPRQRFDEVRPSAQAGMLCAKPAFWRFLREQYWMRIENSDQAATAVREICGVSSRRELTPGSDAAARWHELSVEFDVWMREPFK